MTGPGRQLTQRRRGMTLTEVLMVAMIMPLVVGVFAVLADQSQQTWLRTDTRLTSLTASQRALDRVSEELRRSTQVSVTCVDAGTLRFTTFDGATLEYSRNDQGQLIRRQIQQGPDALSATAGNLTSFAPTCENSGLVTIRVGVRVDGHKGFSTQTLESRVFVMTTG